MAAANTDLFKKKRSNFSTTLNGAIGSSDATIALSSTSGLPTDTAVLLTIDRVDSNGNSTPTKMERVVGVVSSNNLTTSTRGVDNSPSAQAHSSGAVVEDIWDALSWNDALKGILVEHLQSGVHSIPASSLVGDYVVDTGAANAYVATLIPTPTLTTGMKVRFKAANANTTASTLNVNGTGVKSIKKNDGATALSSGDIVAGQIVNCIYDGTNFQMISPSAISVNTTDTQTVTNKRVTKRVVTVTQSATPTINTDNTDVAYITGLAQAVTSFTTNLTGTPVNGDTLIIDITDNGTARALTFGASFEASGNVALPTTTVISTKLTIGFRWNTATSKWTCVAVA